MHTNNAGGGVGVFISRRTVAHIVNTIQIESHLYPSEILWLRLNLTTPIYMGIYYGQQGRIQAGFRGFKNLSVFSEYVLKIESPFCLYTGENLIISFSVSIPPLPLK